MALSPDIMRLIIPRLSLWDARSLQQAHHSFAPLVHEHVACLAERARELPRPQFIDRFLKSTSPFQELVHQDFVFLRTPRDCTLRHTCDGTCVLLYVCDGDAHLELRVTDPAARPTFATLGKVLTVLWWFGTATACRLHTRTRASTHRPVSEVLNSVATAFVERFISR